LLVADTNLVISRVSPDALTGPARVAAQRDSAWHMPRIWATEFAHRITKGVRKGDISHDHAWRAWQTAQDLRITQHDGIDEREVLDLALRFGIGAYDAHFVWLSRALKQRLVTADGPLCARCPGLTLPLVDFAIDGKVPAIRL